MLENIFSLLGWTYGQKALFAQFLRTVKVLFAGGLPLKKMIATLLASLELFGAACFKTPVTPRGEELSIPGYELVFEDEFEGNELNLDNWYHRACGTRRGGFNGESQAKVKDGNLVLTAEYLEDGKYGSGWYTGMVALKEKYTRGYFEIKCKINSGYGFWSAFWLQGSTPYDHKLSDGGRKSVEIDIFESQGEKQITKKMQNSVYTTIHCNGVDDNKIDIDSQRLGTYLLKDAFNEYNTYGLLWTEDEYIFYINGVETIRSTFGKGVCQSPEEVIVSLEMPDGLPDEIQNNHAYKTEYTVDYVRIYQLPEN